MAFSHGSKAVFKIQNAAGVSTDITVYLDDITLPRSVDTAETTTLGKLSKTRIAGLKDASLSGEGPYDPVIDALLDGILGMLRTFEFHPAGTATGTVKYSGSCIVTGYDPGSAVDDASRFSFEAECSDDITRAINP